MERDPVIDAGGLIAYAREKLEKMAV